MGWTDERVELLKKLWADGLSASQIAAQLGGVTRNAVIGKVHRLGLSGRAKSPSSMVPRVRKPRVNFHSMRPRLRYHGNTALMPSMSPELDPDYDPLANVVPMGPRVSILQLNESTCRWPFGEPGAESFCYCGGQAKADMPYCPYHARIAYQPLAERRRQRQVVRG